MDCNFPSDRDPEIPVGLSCPRKMKGRIMVIDAGKGILLKGDLHPRLVGYFYLD
jgi:hypothetical protein